MPRGAGRQAAHPGRWLARHGVDPKATVYVGNDVPDVACLRFVGWGVAPADAHEAAKAAARIVLPDAGGWAACGSWPTAF